MLNVSVKTFLKAQTSAIERQLSVRQLKEDVVQTLLLLQLTKGHF